MRKAIIFIIATGLIVFATIATNNGLANPRVQRITIKITERGYEPDSSRLRKGIPTRITFVRTTDHTCAKEIVLPDFNIRRALPLNESVVVNFTPDKRGNLAFACGMNMMRGELIVQ
ncbi:MAG: ATPase [Proteobacteria bacterium]|nr:MAG: ATPase [Pseudomonadota bacterium]